MPETIFSDGGVKLKLKTIERGEKVLPLMKSLYAEGDIKHDESFKNFFKGLGPMIMQNGLGQTIAYMQSKMEKKPEFGHVVGIFNKLFLSSGETSLTHKIVNNLPAQKYIQMQREAIEYTGWMKKFALAFYEEKKPNAESDSEKGGKDAGTSA